MRSTKKLLVAIGLAFAVLVSSMPIQNADGKQIVAQAATIKLSRKTINLKVGETANLKVSGTKKKVKWSSGNKYVVSVTKKRQSFSGWRRNGICKGENRKEKSFM